MAKVSASDAGSSANFTATASASRSGGTVTVSCPYTLNSPWDKNYGGAYYADGWMRYETTPVASWEKVVSKTDVTKGGFTVTGTKTYTYASQYEAKTFTYTIQCGCQGAAGRSVVYGSTATITAAIAAAQFTVTFNKNGGNTPSKASMSVTYGSAYGTLATCTRTGYTFAGWYTAASGGTQVKSTDTVAITANRTLYAHWTANTYTGTFDLRGGKIGSSTASQTKTETYDSAWVFPADPTRAGYTFAGWYTAASGGTKVESGDLYTTAGPKTLYAHWTGNTYTCSFDARGGTVSPGSKSVVCGGTYGELPTPERSGYKFLGWYPTIYSETPVTAATAVTATANHTIYARWEAMSVLHLVDNGTARAITNIQVVENNTVRNIVGCYSVENGEVHQGI